LNPRSPYEDTRFRGEPIRPLWHLSDGSDHRGCVNREQVRKTEASRLEAELTLGGSVLQSPDVRKLGKTLVLACDMSDKVLAFGPVENFLSCTSKAELNEDIVLVWGVLRRTDASTNRIRFNLSQSNERAVIAVSKNREVGVDLEKIRPDRDVIALAARFFVPPKRTAIMNAGSSTKQQWTFARIWVAKEAVLKPRGSGLTFPLDRCCIELSGDGTACRLIDPDHPPDTAPSTIQFLPLEEGWVGAIAADGSGWSVTLCT
jgi:hypothetical protein